MQLHRLVDAWPWLAAHSQVIAAGTLALASIYQVTPLKDACLKACRHPGLYLMSHYQRGALNGFRLGLGHALFCLGCCWALMMVMFAAGVAHLAWMGVLALIMLVEKAMPRGDRLVVPIGAALGALAVTALLAPGLVPGL
jgi:predicted metal-binding membrane protein